MNRRLPKPLLHGVAWTQAIVALAVSVGSTVNHALATSEEAIHVEQFITADGDEQTTLTQMLVYTEETWVARLTMADAPPVIVNAKFGIEDGASSLEFTRSVELDPNYGYTPIDVVLRFERDGAFAGVMQLDILVNGSSIPHDKFFWIARDNGVSRVITYSEYRERQLADVKPIPSDPMANLEPGDIPGESTVPRGFHKCEGAMLCRD